MTNAEQLADYRTDLDLARNLGHADTPKGRRLIADLEASIEKLETKIADEEVLAAIPMCTRDGLTYPSATHYRHGDTRRQFDLLRAEGLPTCPPPVRVGQLAYVNGVNMPIVSVHWDNGWRGGWRAGVPGYLAAAGEFLGARASAPTKTYREIMPGTWELTGTLNPDGSYIPGS